MSELALRLAHKDYGHNKFLESMIVWVDILAPRYWWVQADTYRLSTKQSESTMYIQRHGVSDLDFVHDVSQDYIYYLNELLRQDKLDEFKASLPEGFLQRRLWMFSYKTLRNIFIQRKNHKLPEWRLFLHKMLMNIEHPEFIVKNYKTWLEDNTIFSVVKGC